MKALGRTRALYVAAIATTVFGASIAASPTRALEPIGDADGLGDLSARIIAAEGGPGRNPLSSAAGYGQFLSGTWLEMFGRAYPQVAQTMTREQILALRDIKPLAEDLTNRYAQANAATLRSVGLPASAGELSLAHAIGPHGAVSVLTAEPARPAAELLRPEAIAANPVLKEMTASTLRQWAMLRVKAPAELSPEAGASKVQPTIEPLGPADDFRVDERTKASAALVSQPRRRCGLARPRRRVVQGGRREDRAAPSIDGGLAPVGRRRAKRIAARRPRRRADFRQSRLTHTARCDPRHIRPTGLRRVQSNRNTCRRARRAAARGNSRVGDRAARQDASGKCNDRQNRSAPPGTGLAAA